MSLGFVAGGLLQGAGEGILAEAKTQRDFMLKAIDQEFQGEQQGRAFAQQTGERKGAEEFQQGQQERGFAQQTGERQATQEFQGSESEKGRELTRSEGKLTREQQTAIQKQNETFLASLPSNNPETVDDNSGLKYTRGQNGLLAPMKTPDGQQMSQLRLRVSDKGRLAAADEQPREGETLSAPLPYAAAVEQSRGILGDIRTDKLITGRSDVAKTGADAKRDVMTIKTEADKLRTTMTGEQKLALQQLKDADAANQADKKAELLTKLKAMGIEGDTAIQAAHDMSRETVAKTGAESREPGAAQKIKGDQAAMEEITRQAQKQAKAQAEKMAPGIIARNMPGAEDPFKAFGGKDQFISDYADELANDQVAKKAGDIKMVRTPEQIVKDLQAARGGAAPEAGKPAPAAPAKPAKAASGVGKSRDNPATPQSKEDLDALESGDYYTNPSDGALYQKK